MLPVWKYSLPRSCDLFVENLERVSDVSRVFIFGPPEYGRDAYEPLDATE